MLASSSDMAMTTDALRDFWNMVLEDFFLPSSTGSIGLVSSTFGSSSSSFASSFFALEAGFPDFFFAAGTHVSFDFFFWAPSSEVGVRG